MLDQPDQTEELTRTEKLRAAARVLIKRGLAGNGGRWGLQSRLAEHFGVTRQRVSQIVRQEINYEAAENTQSTPERTGAVDE